MKSHGDKGAWLGLLPPHFQCPTMDRLGSAKSKWTWPPAAGKGAAGGAAGVALQLHNGEMVQTKAKWG